VNWLHRKATQIHAGLLHRWLLDCASRDINLSRNPVIVFAPHQDDETFGCGGLIARKRAMGVSVKVVFMTDGRGARLSEEIKTTEELVIVRRSEALNAGNILGLTDDDFHFLDLPDTTLSELNSEQRLQLIDKVRGILATLPVGETCVPHRRDIHPDHEATYAIVREAIDQTPGHFVLFEYSVWMTWLAKIGRSLRLSDLHGARRLSIKEVLPLKLRAIEAYRSQECALPAHFTDRFKAPYEVFFCDLGGRR